MVPMPKLMFPCPSLTLKLYPVAGERMLAKYSAAGFSCGSLMPIVVLFGSMKQVVSCFKLTGIGRIDASLMIGGASLQAVISAIPKVKTATICFSFFIFMYGFKVITFLSKIVLYTTLHTVPLLPVCLLLQDYLLCRRLPAPSQSHGRHILLHQGCAR